MLIRGDARRIPLPDESVHCVVTSPPYWGLRDYGLPHGIWDGDPSCPHNWGSALVVQQRGQVGMNSTLEGGMQRPESSDAAQLVDQGQFCARCPAWRGSLGLEPTPELYVQHIVEIFREVKRVLRRDGTLWLNMGNCYATGGGKVGECPGGPGQGDRWKGYRGTRQSGKHEYIGMPWRVAFALQADGWYLRSDIIWAKPNPMPESVTDRPTKTHEYLFLLAKSERYFFDQQAVRQRFVDERMGNPGIYRKSSAAERGAVNERQDLGFVNNDGGWENGAMLGGRNIRTIWNIPTQPYSGAHFATFPEKLVELCILAGASERGCCPECGAPWRRVVKVAADYRNIPAGWDTEHKSNRLQGKYDNREKQDNARRLAQARERLRADTGNHDDYFPEKETSGWRPTCPCNAGEPVRCVVLDPFAGSGTVGKVAYEMGRRFVLLDLKYQELQRERVPPLAFVGGIPV